MASGLGLDILQDSDKFPCAVRRTGVGRSSIRCSKCSLWVHYKKCSGLKTLAEDMSYECPRCHGEPGVRPIDGRPFKEVEVGDCVLVSQEGRLGYSCSIPAVTDHSPDQWIHKVHLLVRPWASRQSVHSNTQLRSLAPDKRLSLVLWWFRQRYTRLAGHRWRRSALLLFWIATWRVFYARISTTEPGQFVFPGIYSDLGVTQISQETEAVTELFH